MVPIFNFWEISLSLLLPPLCIRPLALGNVFVNKSKRILKQFCHPYKSFQGLKAGSEPQLITVHLVCMTPLCSFGNSGKFFLWYLLTNFQIYYCYSQEKCHIELKLTKQFKNGKLQCFNWEFTKVKNLLLLKTEV